jgi:hypothetical protein
VKNLFGTLMSLFPVSGRFDRGDDSGTGLIALMTNNKKSNPVVRLIFLKVRSSRNMRFLPEIELECFSIIELFDFSYSLSLKLGG